MENSELFVRQIEIENSLPNDAYFANIPSIKSLENKPITINNQVSIFVGENGSGKSTLLEALAILLRFNPEGGTRNYCFSTYDTHSSLHDYLKVTRGPTNKFGYFLRAESFYNVATKKEQDYDLGAKTFHAMSHGESFLCLANEFPEKGLYILDEPEAALSPIRLMSLLCIINDRVKQGSQFIIATHSSIMMSYPNADIFEFDENGINKTTFKETDHYKITKRFIENSEGMFSLLFKTTQN